MTPILFIPSGDQEVISNLFNSQKSLVMNLLQVDFAPHLYYFLRLIYKKYHFYLCCFAHVHLFFEQI